MTLQYIRKAYGVPAKRFARIRFQGQPGSIVGSRYQYLEVKLDDEKRVRVIHPTWEVEYLDAQATAGSDVRGSEVST